MRPDDAQVETAGQWLEHSEAWRYAHLDHAPSEYFRRMAIQEHEQVLRALTAPSGVSGLQGWLRGFPKRKRRS